MKSAKQSLVTGLIVFLLTTGGQVIAASPPDREDDVDAVRIDVYVSVGGALHNPVGFCRAEPCAPGQTSPNAQLFNVNGAALGVSWGEFQAGSATSRVSCVDGGAATEIRLRLAGLIPNSVYSVFYRTFAPDSVNPFCPNEERSIVVPNGFQSSECPGLPDSKIVTNAKGAARFEGIVDGCLFDASTVLLDVIYHANGDTYCALPNQLEFLTQLTPCQTAGDCSSGDECVNQACQPPNCEAENTCNVCHSSFGGDAMRQMVIAQKAP